MAIIITDECISCGACEPECPNNAIYEGGMEWAMSEGTSLNIVKTKDGEEVSADEKHEPLSDEFYFIVSEKCTECVGFYDEPQCAAVCPVDCCVPDPENIEGKEELLNKKAWLHQG